MEKPRGAGAMRDFSLHVEVERPRRQMRGTGKPAPQEAHTRRLSVGRIARQLWFPRKVKGSLAELCSETMTTLSTWLIVWRAELSILPPTQSEPMPRSAIKA